MGRLFKKFAFIRQFYQKFLWAPFQVEQHLIVEFKKNTKLIYQLGADLYEPTRLTGFSHLVLPY